MNIVHVLGLELSPCATLQAPPRPAMAKRSFRVTGCCSFLLPVLTAVVVFCTAPPAQAATKSFESHNTLQLARTLLKDHRYLEAVSLLQMRLQTQVPGEPRLPLVLLLSDGFMGLGDLSSAETSLSEADRLVVKPAEKNAVNKRRTNLERLRLNLPAPAAVAQVDTTLGTIPVHPYQPGSIIKVSNSFFETDLRQVLTDLSMESGVAIIWDATVQGLVTYEAKDQPLEEVLKAILLPAGYSYAFTDGAYYVGSSKPEDPAFGLLSQTDVVVMANLDATEAIGLMSEHFQPYVKASKSSNIVCITAPATLITRIKADLVALDQPQDQVMIEVIVTEISRDALREMGLDWTLTGTAADPAWSVGTDHTSITNPTVSGSYTDLAVDFGNYTVDLVASLEALMQSGDAKIRANPHITTLNSHPAQISLTKDQYFIIQTGSSQYYQYNTLQSVSSGIKLEITPYTAQTGEITLFLKPEVGDVVGQGANDLPEISRRAASTSVRVMDGETFSIGGLSLQSEKNVQKKIPFLGDIPVLGYLFRYDRVETKDTEIVIFVTPHILKG